MSEPTSPTQSRQTEIYLDGVRGKLPIVPVDFNRLQAHAQASIPAAAFAYFAGGAGLERTMESNRRAFDRWQIVPRMLRGIEARDTTIELFGQRFPAPLMLAPVGVLELAHAEADVAVAAAAAACGVPMIFSNQASKPMEAAAAVMGDSPRWFQLYWSRSDELVASFLSRAEACGCTALVVTVDTTLLGWRTRDLDHAHLPFLRGKGIAQYTSDPVFQRLTRETLAQPAAANGPKPSLAALGTLLDMARTHPGSTLDNLRSGRARAAVQTFVSLFSRPNIAWEHLPFLRAHTRLPILLKGIQHPDDARRAVDAGMDGLIVSNHGGRQVDGAIGALEALPAVVDAVPKTLPVLFDSGVRTGADAFKAVALGARAACLGRPFAYGLAAGGRAGVESVLRNFMTDFEITMGLSGCRNVSEIDRAMLQPAAG
jgi:lactate 2-monooxygenase